MFININKKKQSNYLYKQIYEQIKNGILKRQLKSNEKLPSKRELAGHLNISVNSVSNAYEQLLAEGYIYTIERKGYYVENIAHFMEQEAVISNKLTGDLKEGLENKEGWLSLSHMTSDISLFPFKQWVKCQQKAINNHFRELSEIPHPQGPYIVRKTISRMIALTRGVKCEPEQIVIGAGTQLLIRQLMELQQKNTVNAVENPGYARIYKLLRNMGFEVLPISLDQHGINIEELKAAKATFLFITPSHQFPTGMIMPISRRIELLNWSTQAHNRYIVEDDYDSEFKYKTDNIPSLQSLDRNQRVIYIGTFSKTLLPGFRVSYMVLPPDILRFYRKYNTDMMQSSNLLALYTLHYFIDTGEYAKHVRRMNNKYETRRSLLIKGLQERFDKGTVQIDDIPAGLHFLAHFKTDKSCAEIEEKASQEKIEIYTMRRFMLNNNYTRKNQIDLIIGFASVNEEDIPEAIERLYRVFN